MKNKVIIMVGPPCSGKSTLAKKIALEHQGLLRVNRDEIRAMLKGAYVFGISHVERLTTDIEDFVVKWALHHGYDVLVDATHCTPKSVNKIKAMVPEDVEVEIEFITCDIPYWKQRWRNFWRWIRTDIWIPAEVSQNMDRGFKVTKIMIEDGKL
jgi:predicted kinase